MCEDDPRPRRGRRFFDNRTDDVASEKSHGQGSAPWDRTVPGPACRPGNGSAEMTLAHVVSPFHARTFGFRQRRLPAALATRSKILLARALVLFQTTSPSRGPCDNNRRQHTGFPTRVSDNVAFPRPVRLAVAVVPVPRPDEFQTTSPSRGPCDRRLSPRQWRGRTVSDNVAFPRPLRPAPAASTPPVGPGFRQRRLPAALATRRVRSHPG
jgi:hypothetical protein